MVTFAGVCSSSDSTYSLSHAPLNAHSTDSFVAGLNANSIQCSRDGLAVLAPHGAGLDLILESLQVGACSDALLVRVQPSIGAGVVCALGAGVSAVGQVNAGGVDARRDDGPWVLVRTEAFAAGGGEAWAIENRRRRIVALSKVGLWVVVGEVLVLGVLVLELVLELMLMLVWVLDWQSGQLLLVLVLVVGPMQLQDGVDGRVRVVFVVVVVAGGRVGHIAMRMLVVGSSHCTSMCCRSFISVGPELAPPCLCCLRAVTRRRLRLEFCRLGPHPLT